MLNIHNSNVHMSYSQLCIVGDSDLAGIYEYLTSSQGKHCKIESKVIVISGYWEYETRLLYICLQMASFLFRVTGWRLLKLSFYMKWDFSFS